MYNKISVYLLKSIIGIILKPTGIRQIIINTIISNIILGIITLINGRLAKN